MIHLLPSEPKMWRRLPEPAAVTGRSWAEGVGSRELPDTLDTRAAKMRWSGNGNSRSKGHKARAALLQSQHKGDANADW